MSTRSVSTALTDQYFMVAPTLDRCLLYKQFNTTALDILENLKNFVYGPGLLILGAIIVIGVVAMFFGKTVFLKWGGIGAALVLVLPLILEVLAGVSPNARC